MSEQAAKMTRLRRVQGVSLPRSGHHLLADVLEGYFQSPLHCGYDNCCQSIPCAHGRVFQKHHDRHWLKHSSLYQPGFDQRYGLADLAEALRA